MNKGLEFLTDLTIGAVIPGKIVGYDVPRLIEAEKTNFRLKNCPPPVYEWPAFLIYSLGDFGTSGAAIMSGLYAHSEHSTLFGVASAGLFLARGLFSRNLSKSRRHLEEENKEKDSITYLQSQLS